MRSLVTAVFAGLLCAQVVAPAEVPARQLVIPTSTGFVKLTSQETESYIKVQDYIRERLQEVDAVKPGLPYSSLSKHFTTDGGLSSPPPHRFVNILCPYIKIEVTFQGEGELRPFSEIPADAEVLEVSKPYFEEPYLD